MLASPDTKKTQKQETGMSKIQGKERVLKLVKSTGVVAFVAALAACAPTAEVFYSSKKEAGVKGDTTFEYRLATSTIAIGIAKKDKIPDGSSLGGVTVDTIDLAQRKVTFNGTGWAEGQTPVTLVAYVAPSPSDTHRVFLQPADSLWQTVTIAPTYRPNSLLLKEVAIDTKDNRKDVIETVGAVALGVVKLAAVFAIASATSPSSTAVELNLPIVLRLDELPASNGTKTLPRANNVEYSWERSRSPAPATTQASSAAILATTPNPGTAAAVTPAPSADPTLATELDIKSARRALFTSECREGILTLKTKSGDELMAFNLTVADPSAIRTIPLPAKGKIELDPLCGGNTTIEQATRATGKELADALFAQIDQLQKAFAPKKSASGQ